MTKVGQQMQEHAKAVSVATEHNAKAGAEKQQAKAEAAGENGDTSWPDEQAQRETMSPTAPTHHQNQKNREHKSQEMALPPKRDKNKKNTIEMMQGQKGCTRQRMMGSRFAHSEDIGQWKL